MFFLCTCANALLAPLLVSLTHPYPVTLPPPFQDVLSIADAGLAELNEACGPHIKHDEAKAQLDSVQAQVDKVKAAYEKGQYMEAA